MQCAEHDLSAWAVFSTTDRIGRDGSASRWRYWFDAQARLIDIGSGASGYGLRPGLGYDISDRLSIWAGYARFLVYAGDGGRATEDRFWQQLSWTVTHRKDATLSMRIRTEQRSVSAGGDTALVLRCQLKYLRPLPKHDKLDLILAVEPFVNLGDSDWAGDAGIRAIRAYVGIGWRSGDSISIETGYINRYVWRVGANDLDNHIAIVNVRKTF